MDELNTYLQNNRTLPQQLQEPPPDGLWMVVAIPACAEPNVVNTLQSLWECDRPNAPVEIIILFNSHEYDEDDVVEMNQNIYWLVMDWARRHADPKIHYRFLQLLNIPRDKATIGWLRKAVMDEAAGRLSLAGNPDGIIVTLDADCEVSSNYLTGIEAWFHLHPEAEAATLHFEHPLHGPLDSSLYKGITLHELFLRYYAEGIRYSGFPYGWLTLGSAMAVRAAAYAKAGGMNTRVAFEDFHFLKQFMTPDRFGQISEITVYPSPRESTRIPAGTGQVQHRWMRQKDNYYLAYDPRSFRDLKTFAEQIPGLYSLDKPNEYNRFIMELPQSVISWLTDSNFYEQLLEVKARSDTPESFIQAFYQRFDAWWVRQYIRHSRDHFYPEIRVEEASSRLLEWITGRVLGTPIPQDLLDLFRLRQQQRVRQPRKIVV